MGGSKRTSHCKWQMTHPRQRRDHPNVGIGKKELQGEPLEVLSNQTALVTFPERIQRVQT